MVNLQVLGHVPGDTAICMYQKIFRKKKKHAVELTYSEIKAKEAIKLYGILTPVMSASQVRSWSKGWSESTYDILNIAQPDRMEFRSVYMISSIRPSKS